jgi:hypothetical protein
VQLLGGATGGDLLVVNGETKHRSIPIGQGSHDLSAFPAPGR